MDQPFLTMAEIEAAYPGQWVLLDRPKMDRDDNLLGGFLSYHCASRVEFDRKLLDFHFEDSAVFHVYNPDDEPVYIGLGSLLWIEDDLIEEQSTSM